MYLTCSLQLQRLIIHSFHFTSNSLSHELQTAPNKPQETQKLLLLWLGKNRALELIILQLLKTEHLFPFQVVIQVDYISF